MKDITKCPNLCMGGKTKVYPNQERAVWVEGTCVVCRGKGYIYREKLEVAEKFIDGHVTLEEYNSYK